MFAIVEIAGQQFKVEEGKKIFVHRLELEEGKQIEFDKVLLIEDEGKIIIGEPVIKEAVIEGKVLDHIKGKKVVVFKKKRRKGYRVKNGHRQNFTQVEIVNISSIRKDKKVAARKNQEDKSAEAGSTKTTPKKKSTPQKKAASVKEKKTVGKTVTAKKPAGSVTKETTAQKKKTVKKETAKPAAKATAKKGTTAQKKSSSVKTGASEKKGTVKKTTAKKAGTAKQDKKEASQE